MNRTIFLTGVIIGVTSVVLGAFASHGLEKMIDQEHIETFETGVRYQMYHAFLLLVLASTKWVGEKGKRIAFYLIALGIVLFSFSIYLLATNDLTAFDFRRIAYLTPIGGMLLIAGWIVIGVGALKNKN